MTTGLENAGLAFGLVVAAGLSTAVGAAAVYFQRLVKLASKPVLAAGLGFSGGVMLYVSFIEIFLKSNGAFLEDGQKEKDAYLSATLCFFAGIALMRLISMLVHKLDQHHDCDDAEDALNEAAQGESSGPRTRNVIDIDIFATEKANVSPDTPADEEAAKERTAAAAADVEGQAAAAAASVQKSTPDSSKDKKLMRMGVNTAAAIAIHNFPEGLATFVATLADPAVGITLAVAIAIHNIPEGLCVALPVYYATGSRHQGFMWALLSGLSEPVGAFLGWLLIKATGEDMNQTVYGILFGVVAGMMVMIVVMELLPTAYRYDPKDKCVSASVVAGMMVMAASLCLFQV
eukprot:TRINITY_DN18072_c0_g1_i1.p1 TRINITY_DN18072_c0_g1~~TRINITY_DN18072_c0_g1_i1.p1  ORF type:complete len:364 (-),score=80.01 TRINITY_DN18072_c0_g1_i1:435-1472(-)